MKILSTIAISIAVIVGSLLLISLSLCAASGGVDAATRVLGAIFALADLAAIVAGIRAIIRLNKKDDSGNDLSIR